MRNRYDAEFWVRILRSYASVAGYVLRVVHIALWMTVPTTIWLWLAVAEPPADCVPKFAGYEGNVLCISDFTFLLIAFGMFLLGSFIGACWTIGYLVEIVFRVLHGDRKLPPVQLRIIGAGWWLLWISLGYWLPFIAAILAAHTIRGAVHPRDFGSPVFDSLPLIAALIVFSGYLVGLARGVATGERSLVWRRRENIRTALTNIRATLALTVMLIILPVLSAFAWKSLSEFLAGWDDLDLMVEAALGSFGFYFALLSCTIACSRLVARYASKIGISDQLMPNAAYDWRRLDGQKRAACRVLE